jgi:hypothetical protein
MKFFLLLTAIIPAVLGAALPAPEAAAKPGVLEGTSFSFP